MISLDIVSDPICPWCYIGKSNLDQATAAKGYQPFDIFWRPFQLNPDMPSGGMDRRDYLERKFGSENATKFYAQIEDCLLYTSPSPRDRTRSRMPSSA